MLGKIVANRYRLSRSVFYLDNLWHLGLAKELRGSDKFVNYSFEKMIYNWRVAINEGIRKVEISRSLSTQIPLNVLFEQAKRKEWWMNYDWK